MTVNALDAINAREASTSIYAALLEVLDDLGPYQVETKKTSLHITRGRAFLGLHPRANGILVNIVSLAALAGPRVRRTEQVSRNRFHNEVLLTSAEDVDGELSGWIAQAYTDIG